MQRMPGLRPGSSPAASTLMIMPVLMGHIPVSPLVHAVEKELAARGVKVIADDLDDLPALVRLASRLAPRLRRQFLDAVLAARNGIDLDALAQAVLSGNLTSIEAAAKLSSVSAATAAMEPILRQGFLLGAQYALEAAQFALRLDLVNPYATQWAQSHAAELVTEISRETGVALRTLLELAFTEGRSPAQTARAIRDLVGLTSRQAAAVEKFRARLLEEGIVPERVAARTEKYSTAQLRWRAECLIGDTPVTGAMVRAVFRRWYEGPMIIIQTTAGRQFTATPNHPMLTRRGWIAAGKLNDSDDLICDAGQQNTRPFRDRDVQQCPPTLREIFNALSFAGAQDQFDVSEDDFHGDGGHGKVDIFRSDRMLAIGMFAALDEPTIEAGLSTADQAAFCFCSLCHGLLTIDQKIGIGAGTLFDLGSSETIRNRRRGDAEPSTDFSGGLATSVLFLNDIKGKRDRFRATPARQPDTSDESANGRLTDSDHRCHFPRRQAASIETDRVVLLRKIETWSGHVYNLQTDDGYYNANGVYTGNTIARTETLTASNQGQQGLWQEAKRQGLLNPETTRRVWLVTNDDRLDTEICEPLDGEETTLDTPFPGGIMSPPAHPSCRCSLALKFVEG